MKSFLPISLALAFGLAIPSLQATAQEKKQPPKQQNSDTQVLQILEKVLTPLGQVEVQPAEPDIPPYPGARCKTKHVNMTSAALIVSCHNSNPQGIKVYPFRTDGSGNGLNIDYVWDMVQTAMQDDRFDFQVRYKRDEIPPTKYCGLNEQYTQKLCREPLKVGLIPVQN